MQRSRNTEGISRKSHENGQSVKWKYLLKIHLNGNNLHECHKIGDSGRKIGLHIDSFLHKLGR